MAEARITSMCVGEKPSYLFATWSDGRLRAYRQEDGKQVWSTEHSNGVGGSSVALLVHRLFSGVREVLCVMWGDGSLGLNACGDGKGLWRYRCPNAERPCHVGGELLLLSTWSDGSLRRISVSDGSLLWSCGGQVSAALNAAVKEAAHRSEQVQQELRQCLQGLQAQEEIILRRHDEACAVAETNFLQQPAPPVLTLVRDFVKAREDQEHLEAKEKKERMHFESSINVVTTGTEVTVEIVEHVLSDSSVVPDSVAAVAPLPSRRAVPVANARILAANIKWAQQNAANRMEEESPAIKGEDRKKRRHAGKENAGRRRGTRGIFHHEVGIEGVIKTK